MPGYAVSLQYAVKNINKAKMYSLPTNPTAGREITLHVHYVLTQLIGSNSTWLDSTQLDFVEPVETSVSSETSRALPTWRTTNDLVQV